MNLYHKDITVGLFGTCDEIPWREEKFIPVYEDMGIKYYNPILADWDERLEMSRKGLCPSPTEEENYYLNNAEIILFPILKESLGTGSLAETGYCIQRVIKSIMSGKQQFSIILIDDDCIDTRKTESERRMSINNRALTKSKIKERLSYPVITMVETLDQMLSMSLTAYEMIETGKRFQKCVNQ